MPVWSNFQLPPEFVSSGMYLLVHFKTDDTINWKGFDAVYTLASPDAEAATPLPTLGYTKRYDLTHLPKPKNHKPKYNSKNYHPIDEAIDMQGVRTWHSSYY